MNKEENENVYKLHKDIKVNIATIVIAAILIYVVIVLIIAARKKPITTYKVNKSDISNNITLNGLIVREEQILYTQKSGYVCYYIRDGEKVKKNSTVCTVDETGQVYDVINDSSEYDNLLTSEDYQDIRSAISLYKVTYQDTDFYEAYNFETSINNKVLELTNEIIMQQLQQDGSSVTLSAISSPDSGLVTYYIDGYENYDISSVSMADFDKSKYEKQTLKSGDIISANSPVVKIIPSEKWDIIAPITAEQIQSIADQTTVKIKINNSTYTMSMPYEIINGSDGTYIDIKIDKYLSNFLSERFVSVEIIMAEDSGLKIPVSSLVEKEVYQIPLSYLSGGGNQSSTNRINVQVKDENGEVTIKQVSPSIYKADEEYCYVDPLAFEDTDVLIDIESNSTTAVSLLSTTKIEGVYTANRGIADFKMVTVIKTVDEFALVESDEELKVYDNIILDSSQVQENQIIY